MKMVRTVSIAFASLICAGPAFSAPCAGFVDVDTNDFFCSSVEWMKNREVTTGCAADRYCPDAAVLRDQMALFMNRLGNLLKPSTVYAFEFIEVLNPLPKNACATSLLPAVGYPRKASATGRFDTAANNAAWYGAYFVWSSDGFANVSRFADGLVQRIVLNPDPYFGPYSASVSMVSAGVATIPAGVAAQFAIHVIADPSTTSAEYNCQIAVQVFAD